MRWRIARSERESGTGSFRSRDGARLAAVAEANLPPAWPVDGHDERGASAVTLGARATMPSDKPIGSGLNGIPDGPSQARCWSSFRLQCPR